jgi:SAM-dependent methyltransferase
MKAALLRSLARLGVLAPTFRAWEAARAVRGRGPARGPDGLLLPPARLRIRVAGTPDADWFLSSGRAAAETIAGALRRTGPPLEASARVLDFGCGCGRVLRHLARLPGELHGCDANTELVGWCRDHLPFGEYRVNTLAPPLPYGEASFDVVYTLSVFTHLPEALQRPWLDELHRVVRPGGRLLLTTHGDRYVDRLTAGEQRRFRAGELVVRWGQVAGTNLCTTFHPRAYLERLVSPWWDLAELVPEGALGNPHQDLVALRRE